MTTTAKQTTAPKVAVKRNGKYQQSTYLAQLANQCLAQLGDNWHLERNVEQCDGDSDFAYHIRFDFITDSTIITASSFQVVQGFKEMSGAWSCYVHTTYPDKQLAIRVQITKKINNY